ncbi:MAG: addiction module protein [Verrucomicrobiae bacterium]|nr:addiction module protein [Verrucomicrobiae bacterium]
MTTTIQLEKMSRTEKLKVMEALWEDLSRNEAEVESPFWHQDALRETEARYAAGQETPVDWDAAKKALRDRFE